MYASLSGVPCDNGFMCGFWRNLDRVDWVEVLLYEFFTFVPLGLTILSFWGLYKASVLFKTRK